MNWERPRIPVTAKSLENKKEIECLAVSLSYNEHRFVAGRREKLGETVHDHFHKILLRIFTLFTIGLIFSNIEK